MLMGLSYPIEKAQGYRKKLLKRLKKPRKKLPCVSQQEEHLKKQMKFLNLWILPTLLFFSEEHRLLPVLRKNLFINVHLKKKMFLKFFEFSNHITHELSLMKMHIQLSTLLLRHLNIHRIAS